MIYESVLRLKGNSAGYAPQLKNQTSLSDLHRGFDVETAQSVHPRCTVF